MNTYTPNHSPQHFATGCPRLAHAFRAASAAVIAMLLGVLVSTQAAAETHYSLHVLNLASDDVFFDDNCSLQASW